jgi:pyrophosphatase PpaX
VTPRPLFFDLDGTLVDTIALLLGAMRAAFDGRQLRPTDDEWIALIGTPLQPMLRRWARDDADVAELVKRYRAYQMTHHDALTQPYPGVVETIEELGAAGHPLAVVTSKSVPMAMKALEHVGIARHFRLVVGLETTRVHKPAPEPVLHALAHFGETVPARAVFIGDSPHDVRAGNAAGVTTIAAQWGPYTRKQLAEAAPTAWLRNIRDLPSLLAELDRRTPPHGVAADTSATGAA